MTHGASIDRACALAEFVVDERGAQELHLVAVALDQPQRLSLSVGVHHGVQEGVGLRDLYLF